MLPKRAVGKAFRAGFEIQRPAVTAYSFRVVNEDIYAQERLVEQVWENDVFAARLPVAFRKAIGRRVRRTTTLPKGRYRHICRWIEPIA